MIRNNKTVDPRDKNSPKVVQLETAMGAAIECFSGSAAIEVPRSRFAPVKSTSDLLALRSDAYEISENGQVSLASSRDGKPPIITLSDDYKLVDQIEGLGVPSLLNCESLTVEGRVHFHKMATLQGNVTFRNQGNEVAEICPGIYKDRVVELYD